MSDNSVTETVVASETQAPAAPAKTKRVYNLQNTEAVEARIASLTVTTLDLDVWMPMAKAWSALMEQGIPNRVLYAAWGGDEARNAFLSPTFEVVYFKPDPAKKAHKYVKKACLTEGLAELQKFAAETPKRTPRTKVDENGNPIVKAPKAKKEPKVKKEKPAKVVSDEAEKDEIYLRALEELAKEVQG